MEVRLAMQEGHVVFRRQVLTRGAALGAAGALFALFGPRTSAAQEMAYPLQFFKRVNNPQSATGAEKQHLIELRVPVIAEDGANVPVVVTMPNHPMDPDHYIKSIQLLNFNDPVINKGVYNLTAANGQAYVSTQIRSDGGDSEVFAICECTQHGKWVASKKLKVSLGGC